MRWTWCWGKRVLKEFCWSDDGVESLKDWWQYLKASPVTCEISSDVVADSFVIDTSFSTSSSSSQEPKITCSFHWPYRHHIIIEHFVMYLLLIFHIGPGQHWTTRALLSLIAFSILLPIHNIIPTWRLFITAPLTVWSVIRHTWNLWWCHLSSAGINHATLPGTYSTRWGRQIVKYIFWVVTEICDIFIFNCGYGLKNYSRIDARTKCELKVEEVKLCLCRGRTLALVIICKWTARCDLLCFPFQMFDCGEVWEGSQGWGGELRAGRRGKEG